MNETTRHPPVLVRSSRDEDVEAMFEIYRQHILGGVDSRTVLIDDTLEAADLKRRRKNMSGRKLPHLVAERAGKVVGYAYVVPFRKRPAYRHTLKHSIYVHRDHVGTGIGGALLPRLIDACAAAGYRQVVGYIDAANTTSLALHEKFGFERAGLLKAVAFRYGKWSDAVLLQRALGPGATSAPGIIP